MVSSQRHGNDMQLNHNMQSRLYVLITQTLTRECSKVRKMNKYVKLAFHTYKMHS